MSKRVQYWLMLAGFICGYFIGSIFTGHAWPFW